MLWSLSGLDTSVPHYIRATTMPTAIAAEFIGLADYERKNGETSCPSGETKSDNSTSQLERCVLGAIFVQFAMQRAPINAEDFSGARFIPAGHSERLDDVILLKFAERHSPLPGARDQTGRVAVRAHAFRQIIRGQIVARGQSDGALDHILQFARVARP